MLPQPQEEGNGKNLDKRYLKRSLYILQLYSLITVQHQTLKLAFTRSEFFTTENVANSHFVVSNKR